MRGVPWRQGEQGRAAPPALPGPLTGVCGSVPPGPLLSARATGLRWLFFHITVAGAHSWLKLKADTWGQRPICFGDLFTECN